MPMKILVFGNPLVKKDSLAIELVPELKKLFPKIEFKELDAAENIEEEGRNLIVLDVAQGIDHVTLLEDLSILEAAPQYSMHDFDLALTLKILKKMKKIDSVKIIAMPMHYEKKKALKEIQKIVLLF